MIIRHAPTLEQQTSVANVMIGTSDKGCRIRGCGYNPSWREDLTMREWERLDIANGDVGFRVIALPVWEEACT